MSPYFSLLIDGIVDATTPEEGSAFQVTSTEEEDGIEYGVNEFPEVKQGTARIYPNSLLDRLFGKKEQFGIKLIDLICPSSNTTLVVSYTIIEEMSHPLATNRLFSTKERMPVAIEFLLAL
ncbi:uncharacterized protein A4U43_UnF12190 [Asparagus officinalis]|uniref:Uncharacterized protein n=1 Tax=Asparagus officinalis TaxID=4686 RepID=A0A1R3L552_ASPOF|nr:uncharacterized protein A4U43_UnF12190 [Asparagus officinalis]